MNVVRAVISHLLRTTLGFNELEWHALGHAVRYANHKAARRCRDTR